LKSNKGLVNVKSLGAFKKFMKASYFWFFKSISLGGWWWSGGGCTTGKILRIRQTCTDHFKLWEAGVMSCGIQT